MNHKIIRQQQNTAKWFPILTIWFWLVEILKKEGFNLRTWNVNSEHFLNQLLPDLLNLNPQEIFYDQESTSKTLRFWWDWKRNEFQLKYEHQCQLFITPWTMNVFLKFNKSWGKWTGRSSEFAFHVLKLKPPPPLLIKHLVIKSST